MLGTGSIRHQYQPVQILPEKRFSKISAGHYASYALDADNTLWSTGDSTYNGLGISSSEIFAPSDSHLHTKVTLGSEQLDFGSVVLGESSVRTLTINNGGSTPYSFTSNLSSPFSIVNNRCDNVAGGESCTINIAFTPSEVGEFETSGSLLSMAFGNGRHYLLKANSIAPTATPTPTVTNTPTTTPTFTPTASPTVASPTPTLTPTATATPTPTPTPIPTIAANKIVGLLLDSNRKPLVGVLIRIPGVGLAITNEKGEFSFTVKTPSKDYEISISAPSLGQEQSKLTFTAGVFREVKLEVQTYNPHNCTETTHTTTLLTAHSLASKLQALAQAGAKKSRQVPGRNRWGKRLAQTTKQRLERYLTAVIAYPLVTLSCQSEVTNLCHSQTLRPIIKTLTQGLKSLRRTAVRANNLLRAKKVRPFNRAIAHRAKLRKLFKQSQQLHRQLDRATDVCA